MNRETMNGLILKVLKDCDIRSFPIDCFKILDRYGLKYFKYSELEEPLHSICFKFSEDSLNYEEKICYNEKKAPGRIRFSLMHELGHVLLNHGSFHSDEMEQDANSFASNILAPRIVIHHADCKNENDVSKLFDVTFECARYAFQDYRRWHRYITYYKLSELNQELYRHFYDDEYGGFVYSRQQCQFCFKEVVNGKELCEECSSMFKSHQRQNMIDNIKFFS